MPVIGSTPSRTDQWPPAAQRSRIARCRLVRRGRQVRSTAPRRAKQKKSASSSPGMGSPYSRHRAWKRAMFDAGSRAAARAGSSSQLRHQKVVTGRSGKQAGKNRAASAKDRSTAAGSSGPERGMWVEQTHPCGSRSRLNWSRPSQ